MTLWVRDIHLGFYKWLLIFMCFPGCGHLGGRMRGNPDGSGPLEQRCTTSFETSLPHYLCHLVQPQRLPECPCVALYASHGCRSEPPLRLEALEFLGHEVTHACSCIRCVVHPCIQKCFGSQCPRWELPVETALMPLPQEAGEGRQPQQSAQILQVFTTAGPYAHPRFWIGNAPFGFHRNGMFLFDL